MRLNGTKLIISPADVELIVESFLQSTDNKVWRDKPVAITAGQILCIKYCRGGVVVTLKEGEKCQAA